MTAPGTNRPPSSEPSVEALFAAAIGHHEAGRWIAADELYRRILQLQPQQVVALHHRGLIAGQISGPQHAIALIRQALSLSPDYAEAYSNLGIAENDAGNPAQAVTSLQRAVRVRPNLAAPQNNLGSLLKEQGHLVSAIPAFRAALAIAPDHPEIHCNLGAALLQQGDYAEGWHHLEWRLLDPKSGVAPRRFAQPRWTGESLAGRTILLHAEQGLGDALQFARYATPIAALGAKVILEVSPVLTRLLASVPGVERTVAAGTNLPPFETHLPLMSAPALLGSTIPADIPYLRADPRQVEACQRRLALLPGLKVGLVWAGDPRPNQPAAAAIDRRRSMALAHFLPLFGLPGVTLVTLQKGSAAAQRFEIAPAPKLWDAMDEMADLADTAALVTALDLVITVDTALAHLAGALGKPVWILSRFNGCWRWLKDRADSPWYPTATLFHQKIPGNWDEVIARVTAQLRQLANIRTES